MHAPLAVMRGCGGAAAVRALLEDSVDAMLEAIPLQEALMALVAHLAATPALAPLLTAATDHPAWLSPAPTASAASSSAPAPSGAFACTSQPSTYQAAQRYGVTRATACRREHCRRDGARSRRRRRVAPRRRRAARRRRGRGGGGALPGPRASRGRHRRPDARRGRAAGAPSTPGTSPLFPLPVARERCFCCDASQRRARAGRRSRSIRKWAGVGASHARGGAAAATHVRGGAPRQPRLPGGGAGHEGVEQRAAPPAQGHQPPRAPPANPHGVA